MYSKGAKIQPADGAAKEEAGAVKDVKATAGSPEKSEPSPKETTHNPDAAGMLPIDEPHGSALKDVHTRHERERRDMHTRHEQEFRDWSRKATKMVSGDKGKSESKGKSGTEPG
jgi:hypothetical protein